MLDSWAMISELFRPARMVSSSSMATPPLAEAFDLGEHDVEGLLRPVGRGAGVAEHRGPVAMALVGGVDRVAQPPLLADLGEEPGRRIAAEDGHGGAGGVVLGAVDGRRGPGQGDLDLLGLAEQMIAARPGRPLGDRRLRPRRPAPEEPADRVAEPRPVDRPGHAQDRAVGPIGRLPESAAGPPARATSPPPPSPATAGPTGRGNAGAAARRSPSSPGRPRGSAGSGGTAPGSARPPPRPGGAGAPRRRRSPAPARGCARASPPPATCGASGRSPRG